jgi:hypothetical protein
MNHEQLQADFYSNFEGTRNWHIHADYLADQCATFRTLAAVDNSNHAQNVRKSVRERQIIKENQATAKIKGVTKDDTN